MTNTDPPTAASTVAEPRPDFMRAADMLIGYVNAMKALGSAHFDAHYYLPEIEEMSEALISFAKSRASSTVAPEPPGWQTIESAPKDDSRVLLSNGVNVAQGQWVNAPPRMIEERDAAGYYIDQREIDGYVGWIDYDGGMLPEPTHWMPLPACPAATPTPTGAPDGSKGA